MNPRTPNPTPADDRPVSDTARKIGPPLLVGVLVVTAALLAWLALAPTAIAGPLSEAPFRVPATLVTPPDDGGCLHLVDGDGSSRELCVEELARPDDDDYHFTDVVFGAEGQLVGITEDETGRRLLQLDPATGDVVRELDEDITLPSTVEPRPVAEDAPIEPPVDEPPSESAVEDFVYTEGDQVIHASADEDSPTQEEVVLDLDGPPGYELDQAVLSPDGTWVVVLTRRGEVAVAPTDGAAAPHVWTEVGGDRWIDLQRSIRWDG